MDIDNQQKDIRFTCFATDPKFKRPRKRLRKVRIDKRFQSMFYEDAFTLKYSLDKHGRSIIKSTDENLKKFYNLSPDDENIEPSPVRKKLKDMTVDYARGEGRLFSDSSDESETDEDCDDKSVYHEWSEIDRDAETTQTTTNRLAVCNMDWDRIRAIDLMMLFNSFLPPKSFIKSVTIYPSEYGIQRLKEEERKGPPELIDENNINNEIEENEEGKTFHVERMRQYQIKKLKYYYAIAIFDSPETADVIYTHCNGIEYERSGIRLDLRFIDDDIIFDQQPKEICDTLNDIKNYEPRFFINTALQQAKVHLTWDETDPKRIEFIKRIAKVTKEEELNDSDLKEFVALSDSENENDTSQFESLNMSYEMMRRETEQKTDPILSYRNLLKEIEENEKLDKQINSELEIMWDHKTSKICDKLSKINKVDDVISSLNEIMDQKLIKKEIKREKTNENSKNKEELELLVLSEQENRRHFNFNEILNNRKQNKKKPKNISENRFQVNVSDERFEALYSSHLFNIDPTNSHFHNSKGMEEFILEKQKRIAQRQNLQNINC